MAETIREYLIQLGYKIDSASESRFTSAVTGATQTVLKLATAVEGTAVLVVASVNRMAQAMENLYWMSQRTGATVQGIQEIGYAASQMGGSVDGARASIESLGHMLRTLPGTGAMLKRLGIDPAQSTEKLMQGIAEQTRNMPYYRAYAYAQAFGIDERTFLAMRQGLGRFSREYGEMVKAIGLNSEQAAKDATFFEQRLRSLQGATRLVGDAVAAKLYVGIGQSLERLRKLIIDNSEQIVKGITFLAEVVLSAAEKITQLFTALVRGIGDFVSWFDRLDPRFQSLLKTIALIAGAWWALNLAFTNSALGRALMLLTAFLLLLDDYQAFLDKRPHALPWEKLQGSMEGLGKGFGWIKELYTEFDKLTTSLTGESGALIALQAFAAYMAGRFLWTIIPASIAAVAALAPLVAAIATVVGFMDMIKRGPTGNIMSSEEEQKLIDQFHKEHGEATGRRGDYQPLVPDTRTWWQKHMPLSMGGLPDPNATGPVSGGQDPSSPIVKRALDYLVNQENVRPVEASGMVANFMRESGLNTKALNATGHSGIQQWDTARQMRFLARMGKPVDQATLEEQLAFSVYEMRRGREQESGQAMQAATTGGHAALIFGRTNERYGNNLNEDLARTRLGNAVYAANFGAGNGGVPGAGAPQVTINSPTNVNVHGARDPEGIASAVSRAIDQSNQKMIRQAQGNIR